MQKNLAIIEGARIGWGASGRNGGQIVNGLNASLQTIDKRYGKDTATFVADLIQEGGNIIRERIKTYDIPFMRCLLWCPLIQPLLPLSPAQPKTQ